MRAVVATAASCLARTGTKKRRVPDNEEEEEEEEAADWKRAPTSPLAPAAEGGAVEGVDRHADPS